MAVKQSGALHVGSWTGMGEHTRTALSSGARLTTAAVMTSSSFATVASRQKNATHSVCRPAAGSKRRTYTYRPTLTSSARGRDPPRWPQQITLVYDDLNELVSVRWRAIRS